METKHGWALSFFVTLVACGAEVLVEDGSGGKGLGNGPGAATGWAEGPACTSHDDCPSGGYCMPYIGLCTQRCDPNGCDACGPGHICTMAAACQEERPECYEAVPACLRFQSSPGGWCDDDDPCPAGMTCLYHPKYGQPMCRQLCGPGDSCPEGATCSPCEQGSCCDCNDCLPICLWPDDL